jgi:transcription initiation factor TFIID TATA-box-binding protein
MKSQETRRTMGGNLQQFLVDVCQDILDGDINQRAEQFVNIARKDQQRAVQIILAYARLLKSRTTLAKNDKDYLNPSSIPNKIKPIKIPEAWESIKIPEAWESIKTYKIQWRSDVLKNPRPDDPFLKRTGNSVSVLIFESGKMICTGTKSKEQSVRAINSVASRLATHGIDLGDKEPEIKIQNMVASVNLKGTIKLEKCARILPRYMYEPEQFPALIYRNDLLAVMLVFGSGKLVCTGNKTEEEIFRAVGSFHCILEEKMLISYH